MNADQSGPGFELTERVIGAFFATYNELGPGFLESVYESAMAVSLGDAGIDVQRQRPVNVYFRGRIVGEFRVDLLIADQLIIEVKATESIHPRHEAQLLNYLRATRLPLGLILNFGPRAQFKRLVLSSSICAHPRSSAAENNVQ